MSTCHACHFPNDRQEWCIHSSGHDGDHRDEYGNTWSRDILDDAFDLGYAHGTNVGSWVIGNTSYNAADSIIRGYEDGDPEVLDMQPSPLSGEWADGPFIGDILAELGVEEDDEGNDGILAGYENGFSDGYWDEVIRSAKAVVE